MVLEPPPRPSVDGSRPVSRFQEGSMNDRVSAAPPVQFLGPDQLARFERQFYAASARASNGTQRRDRPLSAQAQLPSQQNTGLQRLRTQPQELEDDPDVPHRQLRHKKSMGFLHRVRDAFGLGRREREAGALGKVQLESEKRISLQHAPTTRPVHHMTKAHSQSHIPQLPPAFTALSNPVPGGATTDRPSRDEIMASYNELMATGFFQAHAIQSTRQPPPGSRSQREMAGHSMQAQPLPRIPSPGDALQPTSPPRPNKYSAMPDSPGSTKSPPRQSFHMQRLAPPPLSHQKLEAKAKASRESLRYNLRGRKRSRVEADVNVLATDIPVPPQMQQDKSSGIPLSATGGSFGSIWPSSNHSSSSSSASGIIRRVSKKLRKMPSGAASGGDSLRDEEVPKAVSPSKGDNSRVTSSAAMSIRMRSPSPDSPGMRSSRASPNTRGEPMPTIPPRSGSVAGAGGANRLRKKNPQYSPQARRQAHSNNMSYPPITLDKYRGLPMPMPPSNRPSAASSANWAVASPNWSMEVDIDGAPNSESSSGRSSLDNKGRAVALRDGGVAAEPLCVVPDANRGIPMVPQIPDTFLKNGHYGAKGVQVEVAARNENNRMDVDWHFGQAL
ncbi:uncharacterized protein PG998_009706 [Apiospora kogelbergensis]|uniref:uncharacterized protein n=1 Tax=Apiospora kogelbergensis TaxID=1337665 RepID=UPI00312E662F